MGGTRVYPAFLKIPGFYIIATREDQTGEMPADLSAQCNKLTVEEKSFLDSQAS